MFQCTNCNKNFKYNYLLVRHENNKTGCKIPNKIKIINNKINDIDTKILDKQNKIKIIISNTNNMKLQSMLNNENKCLYCDKIFINKNNMNRHIKANCNKLKDLNNNKLLLEKEINDLEIQKKELLEEKEKEDREEENNQLRNMVIKLLMKKTPQINITNNKITNNNNLMVNVNINSFGNESLSHITKNDYKNFLSGLFPGFIKFIEKIHFDVNAPENHNICITNLKSKYMCIYDGEDWISKDKNETIDRFIAKKYNLLVDKFDELEESNEIDEKISERFNIFSKNYQDKEAQKNTKNDIMLMMYRKNLFRKINSFARIKFIYEFISYNNKNKIKFK
jgi:hypothetical protein